jgi:iron complex transport system permease protein
VKLLLIMALGLAVLLHLLLPAGLWRIADRELAQMVLIELRLPRTLLALGYGMTLGLSGAALQAVFANPLASPDISGASSGAVFGAVVAMYWLGVDGPLALAGAGAFGALLTLALLVMLAGRQAEQATLLLAGIALSLALGAATTLALALAPSPFAVYDAFDWLMGSFTDRSLGQAAAALIPALLACAWLLRRAQALDLLSLGDDVAASLGVKPKRLTRDVIAASAIAVGACVSVCGAIGFIGLAAPVIARALVRGHPGRALLPAALIGGLLMILADLAVRGATLNRPLPVGVVTALFGTPLFFWLIVKQRRSLTS